LPCLLQAMDFDRDAAMTAKREVVTFTDWLGKTIIKLNHTHEGSIVAFNQQDIHAQNHFNYSHNDRRHRMRKRAKFELTESLAELLKNSSRTATKLYVLFLTHYDAYEAYGSQRKRQQARAAIIKTLKFFKHRLGVKKLFVIFPKDVRALGLTSDLKDLSIQSFILPCRSVTLYMSEEMRSHSNRLIHQYVSYQYMMNLTEQYQLYPNISHYLLSNIFHQLRISESPHRGPEETATAILSISAGQAVTDVLDKLCGLSLSDKETISKEELDNLTLRVSRLFTDPEEDAEATASL